MARAVTTRRSGLVAIVVAVDTNLQYPEVLSELARSLSKSGRRIMLFAVDAISEIESVIDQIWSYQVDCVVALLNLTDTQVALLEDHNVPVILYNRHPGRRVVSSVGCDHAGCGRLLVKYLLDLGHRRFALVHGPPHSSVAIERLGGVTAAFAEAGVHDVVATSGDYSYCSGVAAVGALGGRALAGRAVIAASDMMAIGVLDELRITLGLVVPDEVAVAGFDGIGATRWLGYRLTTVCQPIQRMADATSAMVSERVAGNPVFERRTFAGTVAIGQSTG